MLTNDDITTAVNAAGIETVAELTDFLKLGNLRVKRGRIDAQIAIAQAERSQHNAQVEQNIQQLQQDGAALDAEMAQLVGE